MSKAFVKESNSEEQDETEESAQAIPGGAKNYITPVGAKKLKDELRVLLYEQRPELVKVVSWAASNGDRSENGDYIYGKKKLREIDRRIRFLTKRLDLAEVVDPSLQRADRVLFGATVTVLHEDGQEQVYRIVGIDETDVANGSVSWISPIAKALLNARVGDVVSLRTPKGEEDLEILKLKYEAVS